MKKILVTGSAGLIGTNLVKALRAEQHEVVEFDLVGASEARDICDVTAVDQAIAGCDGVIHLAAISRVAWGEEYPLLCSRVNVSGTKVLLEAATAMPNRPWFILASSREVYGNPSVSRVTEREPIAPLNHYGHSKADAETLVNAANATGLKTAILRLSNVYGTLRDHSDRAVPSLLWRAISGNELQITGYATNFDFVHVDDCVSGFLKTAAVMSNGSNSLPTVHLATGISTSLGTLAQMILQISGSASKLEVLPARLFDIKGFCGDPAKAREVLDWVPSIGLTDGLEALMHVLITRGRPLDDVDIPIPATLQTSTQTRP